MVRDKKNKNSDTRRL